MEIKIRSSLREGFIKIYKQFNCYTRLEGRNWLKAENLLFKKGTRGGKILKRAVKWLHENGMREIIVLISFPPYLYRSSLKVLSLDYFMLIIMKAHSNA